MELKYSSQCKSLDAIVKKEHDLVRQNGLMSHLTPNFPAHSHIENERGNGNHKERTRPSPTTKLSSLDLNFKEELGELTLNYMSEFFI